MLKLGPGVAAEGPGLSILSPKIVKAPCKVMEVMKYYLWGG